MLLNINTPRHKEVHLATNDADSSAGRSLHDLLIFSAYLNSLSSNLNGHRFAARPGINAFQIGQ